jgi:hypothetical protein
VFKRWLRHGSKFSSRSGLPPANLETMELLGGLLGTECGRIGSRYIAILTYHDDKNAMRTANDSNNDRDCGRTPDQHDKPLCAWACRHRVNLCLLKQCITHVVRKFVPSSTRCSMATSPCAGAEASVSLLRARLLCFQPRAASSQDLASIQPASSQHPASILPASSHHPASIQPASSQHPAMHNKLCYPSFGLARRLNIITS